MDNESLYIYGATLMMVMVYGAIGIMNLCLNLFGTSRRQKRAEKKEALA